MRSIAGSVCDRCDRCDRRRIEALARLHGEQAPRSDRTSRRPSRVDHRRQDGSEIALLGELHDRADDEIDRRELAESLPARRFDFVEPRF
jgi:hypothetical protein